MTPAPPPPPARVVTVFAAASLTDAFEELGRQFEALHAGCVVRFSFGGSQQGALQLEQGAPADVFATADRRWMEYVADRHLVSGTPLVFARNTLAVIVPTSNPGRIRTVGDLARPGLRIALADEAVPVGRYTRKMLQRLETGGFGAGFSARVVANSVSSEDNVKSIVGKVQLGEADAGIVYASDTVSASVRALPLPNSAQVVAEYPVAVTARAREPVLAGEFVAFVLSPDGARILARHGFTPPAIRVQAP